MAGLVILNPFGLAFLQGTLNRSGGDLLWEFVATVTGGALAALLVMAWIECYIRERMLNRRLEAHARRRTNRQDATRQGGQRKSARAREENGD